MITNAYEFII